MTPQVFACLKTLHTKVQKLPQHISQQTNRVQWPIIKKNIAQIMNSFTLCKVNFLLQTY